MPDPIQSPGVSPVGDVPVVPSLTDIINKWFDVIKSKTKKYQIFGGFFLDEARAIAIKFVPELLKLLIESAVLKRGQVKV